MAVIDDVKKELAEVDGPGHFDMLPVEDWLRALVADNDALRKALGKYGRHRDGCEYRPFPEFGGKTAADCPCTCGLDLALRPGAEGKEKR